MVTNQQLNILTKEISDLKLKIDLVSSTINNDTIELDILEKDIGQIIETSGYENSTVRAHILNKDNLTKNLERNNNIIKKLQDSYTYKIKKYESLLEEQSNTEKNKKKTSEPTVSEHAIVRYFEKILGFDIEKIRGMILDIRVKNLINDMNFEGEYEMEDFTVRIKNKTIVTLYPNTKHKKKL